MLPILTTTVTIASSLDAKVTSGKTGFTKGTLYELQKCSSCCPNSSIKVLILVLIMTSDFPHTARVLITLCTNRLYRTICVVMPSIMAAPWVGWCHHLSNATAVRNTQRRFPIDDICCILEKFTMKPRSCPKSCRNFMFLGRHISGVGPKCLTEFHKSGSPSNMENFGDGWPSDLGD